MTGVTSNNLSLAQENLWTSIRPPLNVSLSTTTPQRYPRLSELPSVRTSNLSNITTWHHESPRQNLASVKTISNRIDKIFAEPQRRIQKGPSWIQQSLKYGGYWSIMGGAVLATHYGLNLNLPEPVLVGALSFATYAATWLLENLIPYRQDWKLTDKEFKIDTLHNLFSTGLFPAAMKALIYGGVTALGHSLAANFGADSLWDAFQFSSLPTSVQVLGALSLGELGFYWGHRLMHEVNALWPFHEVHHSADKLTSLQAGRNNPFDAFKTYSMIIVLSLLGLPDDIFTYVTMLVATNGFLQHSNADIDLGKAEYLISGPKAHRWHHSTVIREGNTNFGNTLMIWDHMPWHKVPIFGKLLKFQRKTFFMPKDREAPDEVGLNQTLIDDNKSVLQNYMDQIWHPFRKIFFGGDHANS